MIYNSILLFFGKIKKFMLSVVLSNLIARGERSFCSSIARVDGSSFRQALDGRCLRERESSLAIHSLPPRQCRKSLLSRYHAATHVESGEREGTRLIKPSQAAWLNTHTLIPLIHLAQGRSA